MNKSRTNSWIALFSVQREHFWCLEENRKQQQSPFSLPQKAFWLHIEAQFHSCDIHFKLWLLLVFNVQPSLGLCRAAPFLSLSTQGIKMQSPIRLSLLAQLVPIVLLTVWHGFLPRSWHVSSEVSGQQDVYRNSLGQKKSFYGFKPTKRRGKHRFRSRDLPPPDHVNKIYNSLYPPAWKQSKRKQGKKTHNGGKTWN